LVGNPNVGKSTLFNQMTGLGVVTAHYPGKTLDVNVGSTYLDGRSVTIVDLPGTYSLGSEAEESWVTRRTLLDVVPDCAIVVVDATNLARSLVIALQVMDLGVPTVVALNLTDEASRAGVRIDSVRLSESLGVPVLPTVATQGTGVAPSLRTALMLSGSCGDVKTDATHRYGMGFESLLEPLSMAAKESAASPFGLPPRAIALELIQGRSDVREQVIAGGGEALCAKSDEVGLFMTTSRGERVSTTMSRELHGAAGAIAESVTESPPNGRIRRSLRGLATSPLTGIPILIGVLASVFLFVFFAGDLLATAFSGLWRAFASPLIVSGVHAVLGDGAVARTVLWGLDAGMEASLSIGLPYILTFYVLLSLLEDSGYLNAVAFLADRSMHRVGLHGRAVIPLVSGAGCSVPAVLATSVLATERERTIACTLIAMIPCSARTAVIMGAVGHYIGLAPALGVFFVSAIVTGVVGLILDRMIPGSGVGMVMEMFPFRRPSLRVVWRKAWGQFREFLLIATPIVVVGSVVLGGLYESGLLWRLSEPLDPIVVGLLGLPSVAGLTLLFGLLRKEFALQLLVTLGIATMGESARDLLTFMGPTDLFVYALVNTLAMPCVSTVAVLGRTLGWRRTGLVSGVTVVTALLMGALFARVLPAIGWS
jgi:ferrous iron transport protein B